jgi:hypothetical protein
LELLPRGKREQGQNYPKQIKMGLEQLWPEIPVVIPQKYGLFF